MTQQSLSRRFARDDRGAVALMFGLLTTVLFGCLALSIDLHRAYTARAKLSAMLDAAALAGAKLLDLDTVTDDTIKDRVKAFIASQPAFYGVPAAQFATLTITIDRATSNVTVNGVAQMPTLLASIIGHKSMKIDQTASTTYKMKDVELALALDTTGSMADVPSGDTKTKMESLKLVANELVDTLFAQAINDRGIRIAIAPFSSAVNTGSYASSSVQQSGYTLSGYYQTYTGTQSYANCAVERTGYDNATDLSPSTGGKLRSLTQVGGASNGCPIASVMPLRGRSQQANIKTTIAAFSPGGSTAGHIGFAWGWYTLSPEWNGVFGGTTAASYSDTNTSKHLVLMTDGLFNTSYLTGLAPGSAGATTESYQQFQSLCTNAKAKGITVYTILFGLDSPEAANQLKTCASSASQYYSAANGTELQAAFSKVVGKLNQLRLTK